MQKDYLIDRIEESAVRVGDDGGCVFLEFFEPAVQMLAEREISRYPKSDCAFFGGHEFCERKMMAVFQKGEFPQDEDYPIACMQFDTQEGVGHRDVLGALVSLGIERDKIGDINFGETTSQFFVALALGEFVEINLKEISVANISVRKVDLSEVISFEPKFTEMDVIIASMRLDNIIHAAFKLSRNQAAAFIKADKVKVNHKSALKPAINAKPGDIISVRSKGRLLIDTVNGTTKKGNIRLRIKKFS